jgi:hypothetical protein
MAQRQEQEKAGPTSQVLIYLNKFLRNTLSRETDVEHCNPTEPFKGNHSLNEYLISNSDSINTLICFQVQLYICLDLSYI